jgi:thiol-disulfide isomerase/thioredoxin
MHRIALPTIALATTALLGACATQETATTSTPEVQTSTPAPAASSPSATTTAPTAGNWVTLADYDKAPEKYHAAGDVVLFFNATWCPTCQETVKSLDTKGTPPGLTVVSVDYDSNQDLREKYGVTVQHTFVVVSEDGEQQKKFTGSLTGDEIAKQAA